MQRLLEKIGFKDFVKESIEGEDEAEGAKYMFKESPDFRGIIEYITAIGEADKPGIYQVKLVEIDRKTTIIEEHKENESS